MHDVNQGQGRSEAMSFDSGGFWESNRSLASGAIVASAVAAGVVAYMLRKSRMEKTPIEKARELPGRTVERVRAAQSDERVDAAREFIVERVLPEMKPALLAILRDLESQVNQYFSRAEASIKRL